MKFLAYVMEAGGPVTLPGVDGPRQTFASAEEAVALSLEWENAVTGFINDLVDMALKAEGPRHPGHARLVRHRAGRGGLGDG